MRSLALGMMATPMAIVLSGAGYAAVSR